MKALCQYLERKKEFYFDKFEIKKDSVQYLTYKRIWNQIENVEQGTKKMEIDVIDNWMDLFTKKGCKNERILWFNYSISILCDGC